MMGIEAVKSSTPQIVRDKFKDIFRVIVEGTESDTQQLSVNSRLSSKHCHPKTSRSLVCLT